MSSSRFAAPGLRLLPPADSQGDSRVALIDAERGAAWTYACLREVVERIAGTLSNEPKGVVAWISRTVAPSVAAYLGALASGHAVLPIPANLSETLQFGIFEAYEPDLLLTLPDDSIPIAVARFYERAGGIGGRDADEEVVLWRRRAAPRAEVHPDLCLLLSTSGSTGSPKMVRLSARNIVSNATGIREALGIDAGECAVASLPLFYSFGLSVLHSHLIAGARLILTEKSMLEPEFWQALVRHGCTSLAAVPYMYGMLARIGFEKLAPASLRTLTQAGGKLAPDAIARFGDLMSARGGRMFVMYGQTEATARITVLPPHWLSTKLGSVGAPLGGGTLEIRPVDGVATDSAAPGEIIYRGPNVMLGYAESRQHLARGDENRGVLETGDLGYLDADGCLYVTGRLKRFAKVFGLRVSLDEVESRLATSGPVAVTGQDDSLSVYTTASTMETMRSALQELARDIRVHPSAFRLRTVAQLPLLPNGKVDYASLSRAEVVS